MKPVTTHILAATVLILSGCASYDGYGSADVEGVRNNSFDDPTEAADARLYQHDIKGAQVEYEQTLAESGGRAGRPAAGLAITNLLLLPYAASVTEVLTNDLGARDALDTQGDVIWGDQGLVYFIARGVSWEDSPSTAGIKTLLVDRLPWSRQQLDSVDGFVNGLDNPVAFLAQDLVDVAGDLERISSDLGIAIADDNFSTFFLPGQVFHDETLDLTLGKSELSLLRGVISGAEAAVHFFAAYEHAWTLERAFGESVWAPVIADAMDPDHIDGAEAIDYQVAHVNESLGRAIAAQTQLDEAKSAARKSLLAFAEGIDFGVSQTVSTTLDWRVADDLVAAQLSEFLTALADSFDGSKVLPYTEPTQTADLGQLFDGRTIADGENLLVVSRYDDGIDMVAELDIDQDVFNHFLDGVFVPPFDADPAPTLTIGDDVGRLVDNVSGEVSNDFERSVGGTF